MCIQASFSHPAWFQNLSCRSGWVDLRLRTLLCVCLLLQSMKSFISVTPLLPRICWPQVFFSYLCCNTHAEIRRSTVIGTAPQCEHQQRSLKSQQESLLLHFLWTETCKQLIIASLSHNIPLSTRCRNFDIKIKPERSYFCQIQH